MNKNLKREPETGVDTQWRVPKIGRRPHKCNFYEADSFLNDDNNTVVFEVSFAEAMRKTSNGTQAACYFGSALCAFCPNLMSVVTNILEAHGLDLTVVILPSGANDAGLKLDDYEKYSPIEIYTLIGSWLMITFAYDFHGIDHPRTNNMVRGVAQELGVPNEKIPALKSHFELTQVNAIRAVFCRSNPLKEDVKKFLHWLMSKRNETVAIMARYVFSQLFMDGTN